MASHKAVNLLYGMLSTDRKGQITDRLEARDWLLRLALLYSQQPFSSLRETKDAELFGIYERRSAD